MTPFDVGAFIQEFGLPLAMLVGFGWLWLTGRIVSGKQYDKDVAYRDALYTAERADRIDAQKSVQAFAGAMNELADSVEPLAQAAAKAADDHG